MAKKNQKVIKVVIGAFIIALLHYLAHWLLPMANVPMNMITLLVTVIVFLSVLFLGWMK